MPDQAPLVATLKENMDPVAAGAEGYAMMGEAPFDGTVTRVVYIPHTVITGAATNNRTHTLFNRKLDGTGVVSVATLNYGNGTNGAARDAVTIPLSGTAANKVVAQGDVLQFESLHVGTGIADPGGEIVVEITRS